MLIASARPEEEHQPEKHELVPHDSIVSRADGSAGKCALRDTRPKGQVQKQDETPTRKISFEQWRILRGANVRRGKEIFGAANLAKRELWAGSFPWAGQWLGW
jgi:hypothetical protein